MDIYSIVAPRRGTPQSEQADPRQVTNSAGGFTFTIDDETRLRRFLTLGSEGGTYYAGARELTKDNAAVVVRMAQSQNSAYTLVDTIVEISQAGRAPKANPALFALAVAASVASDEGRKYALAALPLVARTGTHLFLFARYVEQFRGWGRGLRRAVARWYEDKDVDDLAYQAVKYRQREGWSHRDLLRLSHPDTDGPERAALYDWICGRGVDPDALPALVEIFERAQRGDLTGPVAARNGLSWEMLPDAALTDAETWRALLKRGMPMTALVRQLPRLTRLGVLDDTGVRGAVVRQLTDTELLRKARVHPINVLVAQRTYASGQSARGSSAWTPNRHIVDALDAAFYAAFGAVEPTGKRTLLALDVSGSMSFNAISGMPITPREASAALALVTMATECEADVVGFTSGRFGGLGRQDGLTELSISPRQRLDDAIRAVSDLPFGSTDCSLPMLWALEQGRAYDTFVVYTDNETWAGSVHPHEALRQYRERTGIDAKLVVVGMTATEFSIADPTDAGMLDVAGFDSAVPGLISDFARA